MRLSREKTDQLLGGLWLIGIGVMIYFNSFWPGILFLLGISTVVQGMRRGRVVQAFREAFWIFAVGVWALFGFHLAALLVVAGMGMVFTALTRPTSLGQKPKPHHHDWLD